ncbi:GerMN domain-containing protein [Candidatus Kaiserbacteria bacterium]|nr:GerMN domain-containing protein [Candidatus Kaiserbacteria bacterium]
MFDWKTWVGILLLPLIAITIWYAMDQNPGPVSEGEPFDKEGNMMKDSPGFERGIWYLSYEEPGAPGLAAKLSFGEDSRCERDGVVNVCDISFLQGERVRIEGSRHGDVVDVDVLHHVQIASEEGLHIKLFYYNPGLDQGPGGVQCSKNGLVAVERVLPETTMPASPDTNQGGPLTESIKLLLRGELSQEERSQGIITEFPLEGVALQKAAIEHGVATLTFSDPQNRTGGGSCFVSILWQQIEATAKQFPTVSSVRFVPEELFQP